MFNNVLCQKQFWGINFEKIIKRLKELQEAVSCGDLLLLQIPNLKSERHAEVQAE